MACNVYTTKFKLRGWINYFEHILFVTGRLQCLLNWIKFYGVLFHQLPQLFAVDYQGNYLGMGACSARVVQYALLFSMLTGVTAGNIKEDDPFALIGDQLLCISESSLSHMIPIGEGECITFRILYQWFITPHLIDAGQFGCVYKAHLHSDSGRKSKVAAKTIRHYEPKEMKNFMCEMAVISQITPTSSSSMEWWKRVSCLLSGWC